MDLQSKTQTLNADSYVASFAGSLNVRDTVYTTRATFDTATGSTIYAKQVYTKFVSGPTGIFTNLSSTYLTSQNATLLSMTGTNLYASNASFSNMTGTNIYTNNLYSSGATISTMTGTNIFTSKITASNASISTMTGTNVYGSFYGPTGSFTSLSSSNTIVSNTLSVSGNTSVSVVNVSSNIVQSGGTATLKATTCDSITTSGGLVYPIISSSVKYESGLGTGDIEFTSIPTWARHIAITFHQLSTYVAKSATTFYIQPGSQSGYWTTVTQYCGAINVFSTAGQNGKTLYSSGYVPMTYTTVDTSVTDSHFSGCFQMNRMGFTGQKIFGLLMVHGITTRGFGICTSEEVLGVNTPTSN